MSRNKNENDYINNCNGKYTGRSNNTLLKNNKKNNNINININNNIIITKLNKERNNISMNLYSVRSSNSKKIISQNKKEKNLDNKNNI